MRVSPKIRRVLEIRIFDERTMQLVTICALKVKLILIELPMIEEEWRKTNCNKFIQTNSNIADNYGPINFVYFTHSLEKMLPTACQAFRVLMSTKFLLARNEHQI